MLLDLGANDDLDITSAELLEQLADALRASDIELALANVRLPVIEMARRSGILAKIGEDRVFYTVDEAIRTLTEGK